MAEETKMKLMLFRLLFLASVLCPAALFAQDTATITGTVTDPTGAAVANAQVTIVSPEHGVTRSAAANGSGDARQFQYVPFAAGPLDESSCRNDLHGWP